MRVAHFDFVRLSLPVPFGLGTLVLAARKDSPTPLESLVQIQDYCLGPVESALKDTIDEMLELIW